jgi:hypothetical protein
VKKKDKAQRPFVTGRKFSQAPSLNPLTRQKKQLMTREDEEKLKEHRRNRLAGKAVSYRVLSWALMSMKLTKHASQASSAAPPMVQPLQFLAAK